MRLPVDISRYLKPPISFIFFPDSTPDWLYQVEVQCSKMRLVPLWELLDSQLASLPLIILLPCGVESYCDLLMTSRTLR